MKIKLIAIAFMVALAAPGLAAAQDLSATFASTCLKAAAAAGGTLAGARAQGFMTPPPQAMDKFKINEIPDARMVWKVREGAMTLIVVGEGPMPGLDGLKADICAVMDMPGSGDPQAALQALLKIEPQGAQETKVFLFEDAAGSRKPLAQGDGAAVLRTMAAGSMRMAMALSREGSTMMMLIAPKPPK